MSKDLISLSEEQEKAMDIDKNITVSIVLTEL